MIDLSLKGSISSLITKTTLRRKLLFYLSLLVFVLMIGTLAVLSRAQLRALTNEVDLKVNGIAQLLAVRLESQIVRSDLAPIIRLAREVERTRDVIYVAVIDTARRVVTESSTGFLEEVIRKAELNQALQSGSSYTVRTAGSDGSEVLTRIAPIVRFNVVEGAVLVGFSREHVLREVTSLRRTVLGLGIAGLLVGILMAFVLARGVTGPIERLKDAAVRVGAGEFGSTVDVETDDEIGALAETFNTMSLELRKREEEIRRSERLSAIGETASVIAHEMKTPLTSVQTYVDMLMYRYDDPAFRGSFTRIIEDQVTRLGKLVDDLLEYSRDPRLNLHDLDINIHIHQAVDFFGDMLMSHKVSALEHYSAQSPVKADPDKLEQVFFNLIKNGIEAQGEGGAISTMSFEGDGSVFALIADGGRGVPKDLADNIFEPFYTTKPKGTGLGLAIARKIVEAHGGEISLYAPLDSLPSDWQEPMRRTMGDHWPGVGKGSCFVVELPAEKKEE